MVDLDKALQTGELAYIEGQDLYANTIKELIQDLRLARETIRLAKDYINESPCDPDITDAQANAWLRYQSVITAYEQSIKANSPAGEMKENG